MATSTHNKYVSIPDWFSSSSSTPITSTEKPANITNVYYGGGSGGGTTGITEIPIDNKTIVWLDLVITVPIDNDKIIINTEGKITTSGTTGVWELRQLTDGTNYIYTTYPVVTQLGITMYAGTDGLDLGSIYDGLPIDNATIYWDLDENGNKILKAVGSSGGVADSVAWVNVTGKPDWLLDGKVLYTEIEGIPDLSGFITKDYIDGKFVTFDLNETIDGIKTFTNGIKIGNSLINQSLNDVICIDANLVVRGGITMYATGTVDVPSILDSLPVAGTDSKGIASFDSSYFSVTNGKVTLLADNVGLNESELAEYLNTNNYAKKSDIPSLNDYAKQSWVESKGYALNSDLMLLTTKVDDFLEGSDTDTIINKWLELEAFLSGLSESDNLATILGNKADKSELTKYIPISGYTEVSGEKNFTGGLKVNGSPIYYDTDKKYWKLEGDLLVTGGVTMYGSDSSFTPSTIMDAILYDDTTLGINSNKQLYVKGGAGGGINTTDLQNYLTQNSYLNVTSGDNRYLKLSGGTLSSANVPLYIDRTYSNSYALIGYRIASKEIGYLGFSNYGDLVVSPNRQNGNTNYYAIWHQGNFNPSNYLPLSGGSTITGDVRLKAELYGESYISWKDPETTEGGYFYGTSFNASKNYTWTSSLLNWNVDTGVINFIKTPTVNGYSVWNSGNDGHNSGLDADTLDGYHSTILMSYVKGSGYVQANLLNSELWNIAGGDGYIEYYDNSTWFNSRWGKVTAHYGFEGSLSGNASSATKLQNSRSIWGRAFDGTSDITGSLYITNNNAIYIKDTSENWLNQIEVSSSNSFNLGYSSGGRGYSTFLYGGDITLKAGASRATSLYIDSNCNAVYNGMFTIKRAAQVPLYVHNSSGSDVCLRFVSQDVYRASLGTHSGDYLLRFNSDLSASYKIWDAGNDGHGSGLDADTLDGYHSNAFMNFTSNTSYVGASMGNENLSKLVGGNGYIEFWDGAGGWFNFRCGYVKSSSSMYIASALFLGDGGEGIYIHGTGVSWHNSSNTWTKSIMYINSNGDVCIGNQQPSARLHVIGDILATGGITMYSMRALKNVVDERGLSLSELSTIKPTRYTWKDGRDNRLHFGGIADDIQQVLPEVVYKTSDGLLTMDYGNAAFAVASSLIKPVVDHEKRIATLEAENKELRNEVERLKAS